MIHTLFLDSRDVHALSDDIQSVLDADGSAIELSTSFRRLLFDVDDALTAVAAGALPGIVTVVGAGGSAQPGSPAAGSAGRD